ncbi:MAG TPA: autorepressor SdpR family transcription factor [Pyrinomonadaceae bacterium]|nr:autorepressor SdpR family transcription factor [Pyrinomonadaceae bacterium]
MDSLFKALNDPTRRRILELLRAKSLTAGEIADQCSVLRPTISHHLDLLMQAELIEQERQGQFRRYHLNTSVVEDVLLWLSKLATKRVAARKPASARLRRLKPRTA